MNNLVFRSAGKQFLINGIALGGKTKLQLSFGASSSVYVSDNNYNTAWDSSKFLVELSADGKTYKQIAYSHAANDWDLAKADFTLAKAYETLYIRFTCNVEGSSAVRIDDMTLAEGEGGTEIDLGEGGEEPEPTPGEAITVNELYRLAETVTGKDKLVIDAENNRTLEAVVVTDVDGGNVSANNLMVMTEGATQAKNGILLFSSGQYTNPKDPAFPFKSGDKVRFTLVKGLAKVANFSNCYEVTCESSDAATWLTAEVIGKAQLTPVPLTSIDNLIDYQGMLVTVKNVTSPATAGNWAVGTTTFKVGSSDLTVYVTQDAAGFAGKQYAASKTGDLTGYVSLYYKGAVQLCPRNMTDAAAFAEGGTDPEPADPAHIVLDFSVGASIFTPALPDKEAQSKTGSYLFDGNYAFNISASNIFYWFQNPYEDSPGYGTKSLFIGKAGSYIELPAIADKALTKVIISAAKGAGAYSIAITDAAGTPVQGGQAQEVTKQEGGEYTYTLSNTANATAYRIAVTTAGNAQLAKIELFYGEGGGSTPVQPTLSVNPTSLSFAAKDQAKTIACTVANADGYTVGASSSDAANFAASVAGTTVTVTPTENTGSARNATITVYLTNDGGATKVAAKTVAVTQAAAGGSEPAGDTYDKITKVAELVNGMTGFIGCEPGGTYGLQLVTGFAAYGQGFTAAYTYDETKKTLSLTSGNYTAIEFTFEAVADGFNIKQGDKYLIGTGIIDNGKPKQGLVLADAPAQPWTFTEDASGVIATTSASGTVDGQAFNYPAIYMMCANSASSRFLRPYVQASYGKGFCFFKKN